MLLVILSYLTWIGMILAGMVFLFRVLRLDRPREVKVPVRKGREQ